MKDIRCPNATSELPPDEEDQWDDEPEWTCEHCHGLGTDPMCDHLLPCPVCHGCPCH